MSDVTSARVAVITGAGSGIGLALTECLLDRRYKVIAIDLDTASLASLKGELDVVALDVRDAHAMQDWASSCDAPLDYLFANAGVGVPGSVLATPLDRWRWVWEVNVMGVIHAARAWWPHLLRGKGTMIATVSAAALQSYPGAALYRATKSALLSVMESLYYESRGTDVRLHALCPGMVRSNIMDVPRYKDWVPADDDQTRLDPAAAFLTEAMNHAEPATKFAKRVLDALPESPPFYWFTHAETMAWIDGRHRAIVADGVPFHDFGVQP